MSIFLYLYLYKYKEIKILSHPKFSSVKSQRRAFPEIYAYVFNANDEVTKLVKTYCPLFLMGTIMFTIQMTLQNINVALGQGKCAVTLAVLRKVIILIPLCFLLSHFLGFKGVYMSEGIADLVAGIITGIVIFVTFPKVLKKREAEVVKKYSKNEQNE